MEPATGRKRCVAVALSITCFAWASAWAQSTPTERGRALFERVWEPVDSAPPQADGLGPLFNDRSCVACHSLGGIGGAGPAEKNIDLLTPVFDRPELSLAEFLGRLQRIHPALADASSIVLHKSSTDEEPYRAFRNRLLGRVDTIDASAQSLARPSRSMLAGYRAAPLETVRLDGTRLTWSQRNTTPLFGLGRIARIAQNELRAVAHRQQLENPEVTGRIAGRFGWRGQVDQLGQFVRSACATELGLNVSTHHQAIDPLFVPPEKEPSRDVDLTNQQCSDLTAFVGGLPMPRRVLPEDHALLRQVEQGETLFENLGCGVCHRRRLANVVGLYSDLLLHDMGEGLADPSPAPPGLSEDSLRNLSQSAYGGSVPLGKRSASDDERRREWKTPALWGLRDSAPYLHDGRADTVEEAILHHRGEADMAFKRFLQLPQSERTALLAFLATLAAPDPAMLR